MVATDTTGGDGWSAAIATAALAPGSYTYYAQATDNQGATSAAGTAVPATASTVVAASVQLFDDQEAGFTTAGAWTTSTASGYRGDATYSAAGTFPLRGEAKRFMREHAFA